MKNKSTDKIANKLVNAFLKNKIISPLPKKYTKKISNAQIFRKLCESKIDKPISGFKAAGTGIAVLRKLKEKEPFYATVYKHNVLNNKKSEYTRPNVNIMKIFLKKIEDSCKSFIFNTYLFLGFKKRSNEKFKNTSCKEILNCLNLFQLYKKNKINFKVEKIEHQVFLIKK